MAAENPAFVDEQRALYESMRSARDICRERWRLRVMMEEHDALFAEIAAEADAEEAAQAIADGNAAAGVGSSASVAPPARFTLGRNDHESDTSTSIVDLVSTGDVHTADSGEEE